MAEVNRGGVKDYLRQADPAGHLVGDVLPVDVSHPGAGDVFHPPAAHPHLPRDTKKDGDTTQMAVPS